MLDLSFFEGIRISDCGILTHCQCFSKIAVQLIWSALSCAPTFLLDTLQQAVKKRKKRKYPAKSVGWVWVFTGNSEERLSDTVTQMIMNGDFRSFCQSETILLIRSFISKSLYCLFPPSLSSAHIIWEKPASLQNVLIVRVLASLPPLAAMLSSSVLAVAK